MIDETRLRALLEATDNPTLWANCTMLMRRGEVIGNIETYEFAELIVEAVNSLPGLLDENARLRAALEDIKRRTDVWGNPNSFQSYKGHHETYREMSETAFRALEGHDGQR